MDGDASTRVTAQISWQPEGLLEESAFAAWTDRSEGALRFRPVQEFIEARSVRPLRGATTSHRDPNGYVTKVSSSPIVGHTAVAARAEDIGKYPPACDAAAAMVSAVLWARRPPRDSSRTTQSTHAGTSSITPPGLRGAARHLVEPANVMQTRGPPESRTAGRAVPGPRITNRAHQNPGGSRRASAAIGRGGSG